MKDIESITKEIIDIAKKHSIPVNELLDMIHEHVTNLEKEKSMPMKKKRKIQYYDDEQRGVWCYFIRGEKNPCGCGSNCYHFQYEEESKTLYGVCNACNTDIYTVIEDYVEERLSKGRWI